MTDHDEVMVQPIKSYKDEVHGWKDPSSEAYGVSRLRASELKANGLVKSVEPPANKMMPAAANKAAPAATKK